MEYEPETLLDLRVTGDNHVGEDRHKLYQMGLAVLLFLVVRETIQHLQSLKNEVYFLCTVLSLIGRIFSQSQSATGDQYRGRCLGNFPLHAGKMSFFRVGLRFLQVLFFFLIIPAQLE